MIKIWERYFILEALKVFLFVLICFFALYMLLDYSSRVYAISHLRGDISALSFYYSMVFIQRMDILFPLAFLIAIIRTLCNLNVRNELVALLASGIAMKRLIRPFILLGFFLSFIIYITEETVLPYAIRSINSLEESSMPAAILPSTPLNSILLNDGSSLVYHKFISGKGFLTDVWLIKSVDDIFHMEKLFPYSGIPYGVDVDHYTRDGNESMHLQESIDQLSFPQVYFDAVKLREDLTDPAELSLSRLWSKASLSFGSLSMREAKISSTLYRQIAVPWLCLLAVLGTAPSCLRFTRKLPVFLIFMGGIFGMIGIYLILNASVILGTYQIVPPHLAIWPPIAILTAILYWRYWIKL